MGYPLSLPCWFVRVRGEVTRQSDSAFRQEVLGPRGREAASGAICMLLAPVAPHSGPRETLAEKRLAPIPASSSRKPPPATPPIRLPSRGNGSGDRIFVLSKRLISPLTHKFTHFYPIRGRLFPFGVPGLLLGLSELGKGPASLWGSIAAFRCAEEHGRTSQVPQPG